MLSRIERIAIESNREIDNGLLKYINSFKQKMEFVLFFEEFCSLENEIYSKIVERHPNSNNILFESCQYYVFDNINKWVNNLISNYQKLMNLKVDNKYFLVDDCKEMLSMIKELDYYINEKGVLYNDIKTIKNILLDAENEEF